MIRSPRLPGGDLVAAVLDRAVMSFADRGGASNLVGHRWADLCAEFAESSAGQVRPVPDPRGTPIHVEHVIRLDATPAIASAASKRGLQNPDLLFVGRRDGAPVIQAADAKFSVETARAKQVSPAVVEALLELGDLLPSFGAYHPAEVAPVTGVFLCPDYPLTHLMLRRGFGILRVTVRPEEVILVPAPADRFFKPIDAAGVMRPLAAVDALPLDIDQSLLAGLYYFRLARAAVSCWLDATKPLLLHNDQLVVDEEAVHAEAVARARSARSAYDLVLRWNADVQSVRSARSAIDHAAGLPISSRELREWMSTVARRLGADAPSVNQVRRRVGAWYRGQVRQRVGPLNPPIANLPAAVAEVARVGAEIAPTVQPEAMRIIEELIDGRRQAERTVGSTAN